MSPSAEAIAHSPLGPIALLRAERTFRRLWYAQLVSEFGDWFQLVAILSLLPTGHGGAHVVGGYLAVRMLPSVIWAPVAGILSDRVNRGRILVACDLARAALVLLYPFVLRGDGTARIALLYALSFAQESFAALFEPARGAVIPQVVPPRGLLSANVLSGATWSAMLALGAASGGWVTAHLGRNTAYVIDAITFVASAAFVLAARLPPLATKAPLARSSSESSSSSATAHEREPSALREGAEYLRSHGAQAVTACLKGAWGLVGGIAVLFTAFADQVFTHNDRAGAARALGVMYLGRGIGSFCGPFIATRWVGGSVAGLVRSILAAFPIIAVGYFALAASNKVWMAAIALTIAHCGGSTIWVHSTQLLQQTVPNHLLGRVLAVEFALLTGAMGLSILATAALLDTLRWTPRTVAVAIGIVPLIIGLAWGALSRWVRPRLEREQSR